MHFSVGIFIYFSSEFSCIFIVFFTRIFIENKPKFNYLSIKSLAIPLLVALTIRNILIAAKIGIIIVANLVAPPAPALALTSLGCLLSLGHITSLGCLLSLGWYLVPWAVVSLVLEMHLEVLIDWPVANKVIEKIIVFPSLQNMGQFARIRQKKSEPIK